MSDSAIVVDQLWDSFGENIVLSGLSCIFPLGGIYGLIGPSGSGKSVLMKLISGIRAPKAGVVRGVPERTSLLFQEGALFDSMTVFDNVAFPLVDGKVPCCLLTKSRLEIVASEVGSILERVGLGAAAAKMPGQLSGGMRRRASLARALVSRPHLALLDDPTSGLDPVASSVIMELICELHAELGGTMIIASHDLRRLLPYVDRVYCLFAGGIVFEGTTEELLTEAPTDVRHFVSCRYGYTDYSQIS